MSQQLWQLIVNHDLQALPATEIHAALTAQDIVVRTPYFLTCNQINLLLPFDEARAFAATLDSLAKADPWFARLQDTLSGVGVDLSLDKSQQLLDQFAAAQLFDLKLIATLKALGARTISLLEQAGLGNDVTAEQIEKIVATRSQIAALRDKVNAIVGRVDQVQQAWEAGEDVAVPTFEEVTG